MNTICTQAQRDEIVRLAQIRQRFCAWLARELMKPDAPQEVLREAALVLEWLAE